MCFFKLFFVSKINVLEDNLLYADVFKETDDLYLSAIAISYLIHLYFHAIVIGNKNKL